MTDTTGNPLGVGRLLLRCPFCGGDEISHGYEAYSELMIAAVQCHKCDAVVTADTEEEAIAVWNTRAPASDSLAVKMEAWAKAGADLLEGPSPAVEAARRTARIYLHAGTTEERERANLIADEILKAAGGVPVSNSEVVHALKDLIRTCTLRSLRGHDHVPSMREQQDAIVKARQALSLARGEGK